MQQVWIVLSTLVTSENRAALTMLLLLLLLGTALCLSPALGVSFGWPFSFPAIVRLCHFIATHPQGGLWEQTHQTFSNMNL